jgi:molybdopterin converting factor small subunit
MRVIVRVYGPISSIVGKRYEVEVQDGATVGAVLNRISGKANQSRGFLGDFKIGSHDLAIIVNGKNIDVLEGTNSKLIDGDEVVIVQPTPGG